ncbi:MAG TPA: response regulator [Candidatus Paceibacterota bacterium]
MKILIVEDNEAVKRSLSILLGALGENDVTIVDSMSDALTALHSIHIFDIIFLDGEVVDGCTSSGDFICNILAISPSAFVVAMSGREDVMREQMFKGCHRSQDKARLDMKSLADIISEATDRQVKVA